MEGGSVLLAYEVPKRFSNYRAGLKGSFYRSMAKKKKPVKSSSKPVAKSVRRASLASLRRDIDKIDQQILRLANERAQLAQGAGLLKRDAGDAVYSPEREDIVMSQVTQRNRGPLSDDSIRNVFRELISGTRSVEKRTRVAYLGPEYTYSHLAAIERFGQSAELDPVASIAAVFEEVERRQVEFGVVPVENSTDGRIADTLEMLAKTSAQICGEVQLRIHHNLVGNGPRTTVREIYSKPQALSQCRNWTAKHLPSAKLIEVASTAEAAEIAGKKQGVAAIASRQAAVNHRLDILAKHIEDNPDNITRFAVIAHESPKLTGNDKTAIMFEIDHRPGSLADAMAIFKRNRLNMTWIESFPIFGEAGRYLFFVEFVAHQTELRARRALSALEKKAVLLVVLGSYARSEPVG